jgi:hypothetical protein
MYRPYFETGPRTIQPTQQGMVFEAHDFGPLPNGASLALVVNKRVPPSISSLFFARGPTAIFRFIITIVVNAFQSVFGCWPFPHVLQKILKRMPPTPANANSSSAIKRKGVIFRIVATSNGLTPGSVFWSLRSPVCRQACARDFSMQAAATLCPTIKELRDVNLGEIATSATAQPITRTSRYSPIAQFENCQASENLTSKIQSFPGHFSSFILNGGFSSIVK